MSGFDPTFLDMLRCPQDGSVLTIRGNYLVSTSGHKYPIVDGVPVLMTAEWGATIDAMVASLDIAGRIAQGDAVEDYPWCPSTIGATDEERERLRYLVQKRGRTDPVVSILVGATSGYAYRHLIGEDFDYPIPAFRFPTKVPGRLLDLGCNWGRWTIGAARAGHEVVGIDPQLGAVLAAKRVANELGVRARFVVGDARFLPFKGGVFDYVWSYSVLQHMSELNVDRALAEVARVLTTDGRARLQMANAWGIRSLYHRARRAGRPQGIFDVRYWTPTALRRWFGQYLTVEDIGVDCYFGLGVQQSDRAIYQGLGEVAAAASRLTEKLSERIAFLRLMADSVFVDCRKPIQSGQA